MQAQTNRAVNPAIRQRLLDGLAGAIVEKGYAAATIGDIARHARVSKRTIYEHFPDKESAFLALYQAASDQIIQLVVGAADPSLPWEEQIDAALRTYLAALESQPELARTFLLEIQAAGDRAIALRREVHRQFAEMIRGLVERGRAVVPDMPPLPLELAIALVGAVNELVLLALEEGRARRLSELRATATTLVRAVLLHLPATVRRR
jgi:AcrR family transcriptional regulator